MNSPFQFLTPVYKKVLHFFLPHFHFFFWYVETLFKTFSLQRFNPCSFLLVSRLWSGLYVIDCVVGWEPICLLSMVPDLQVVVVPVGVDLIPSVHVEHWVQTLGWAGVLFELLHLHRDKQ